MEQKRFRAAGIAVFCVAVGALLFRVLAYYIYNQFIYGNPDISGPQADLILELVFTLPVQVLVCLVVPFLIFKFYGGKSTKEVLIESNFKKCDYRVMLLSVPLAIGQMLIATVISIIWLMILMGFGYVYSPSETEFSATFNVGFFLASMFFTAVLPAICEEFAIRGTFLTALKNSFSSEKSLLVIMALTFGLFHQNIVQLAYTAFFGGLMAYLVIRTKSIYPAIIIHFINNGLSVLFEYGSHYGFMGDISSGYFIYNFGLIGLVFTLALGGGLIVLCIYGINRLTKKSEMPQLLFRPRLRDSAFFVGAIVVTVLSTIFTFAFGF